MTELHLLETTHPDKNAMTAFDALVGIDEHKSALLDELVALLDRTRLDAWQQKHHPKGLGFTRRLTQSAPLVLLSGEVGCGKTAVANAVSQMAGSRDGLRFTVAPNSAARRRRWPRT